MIKNCSDLTLCWEKLDQSDVQSMGHNSRFPNSFMNISGGNRSDAGPCQVLPQGLSLSVLLCVVFLLGSLLNGASLWVFCFRTPEWSTGTLLQFHLTLSNILAMPLVPMMATNLALGSHWPYGRFLCQAMIALLSSHFYGSTVFLMLISVHRYTLVVHFNKDACMKRKPFVRRLCAGMWSLLLIQAIVLAVVLPSSLEEKEEHCLSIHHVKLSVSLLYITLLLFTLGFLLPFSVSLGCYWCLANTLARLQNQSARGRANRYKSQRKIAACLVTFAVCFLPLHVTRTMGVVLKTFYPSDCPGLLRAETGYYVSWVLTGVNCCLDPILYGFGSHNFAHTLSLMRFGQRVVQQQNPSFSAN
ncbi:P2Y purinoceptor 4 [Gadus morhua]|uniref:P2Y purinoceptor 4 n=1 Tax=Gadus morhua TaxID=8049 RepID=UPI0011B78B33|nr:P2Y purinoceptor 4-like [Gadus morhua]